MDREKLIDEVNEKTAGNRHDYLTRDDVQQIVDATISALGPHVEPGNLEEFEVESDDVDTQD